MSDEEIIELVKRRVGDPRHVRAVISDLSGVNCASINATVFGRPKVYGSGRGNFYRAGQRACLASYRNANLEWCSDAREEFQLIRSQARDLANRRRIMPPEYTPIAPQFPFGAHAGVGMGERLSSKDLESHAGFTRDELVREYTEILRETERLERERRIVLTLLERHKS